MNALKAIVVAGLLVGTLTVAGRTALPIDKDVTCPVDGAVFSIQKLMSAGYSGEVDLDLTRLANGFTPLAFYPWTCPRCYYTGYPHDFEDESSTGIPVLSDAQKTAYRAGLKPAIPISHPAKSRDFPEGIRYDLYAQRLLLDEAPPNAVAEALHNAARVTRLTADFPPVDKKYLEKTNKLLEQHAQETTSDLPEWLATARNIEWLLQKRRGRDPQLLALLIHQYHLHGEVPAAYHYLDALKKLSGAPEWSVAWVEDVEGSLRWELSFMSESMKYYEKALAEKENFVTRYLLGDLNRRLKRTEKMEEWYSSIKDVPEDARQEITDFTALGRDLAARFSAPEPPGKN